ncbi:MAG: hypothetical protein ACI4D8_05275 [Wujia sp.]
MRGELKKKVAVILSVVMVMTLILVPEKRIVAATNIPFGLQIEIMEGIIDDSSYTVEGVLKVNGTVTGSISIQGYGNVIVGSTGEVQVSSGDAISISDSGSLKNSGKIGSVNSSSSVENTTEGEIEQITLTGGELSNSGKIGSVNSSSSVENTTEGEIEQITLTGGELSNSGKVTSIAALETTINNSGTIGSIEAETTNVENSGTITTFKVRDAYDTLTMTATSRITNLSCTSGTSPKLTIIATEGAKVGNAEINMNYLQSSSSGSVTITDSLIMREIYGATPDIPAGLKFNVESGTKITKTSETDKWYVYYGGKKYLFPTTAFSDKTISDLYNMTVPTDTIALDDLTVGYSAEETSTDTFTISNTGMCKMSWKLIAIPDNFIELYDENGTQLEAGNAVTLAGGESRTITVKAKTDKGADKYNGSISSEIWTAEAASASDNTLMSESEINITLNVNKKMGSGTIEVNDVYYGTPVTYTASSDTNDGGYTVKFKKRDASEDTYSTELPTEVGEYTARATFAQTDIYEEYVATADFAILRKDGSGTVTVDDIYYGEEISPVVTSATNGIDNVTFEYKEKDADDETYTATKPTLAGEYTVRATFAQTEAYNAVIATDDFTIFRKTGSGTIKVADIYYGETLNPVVASDANGTVSVIIEYKRKNAGDETYTETEPTLAGEYTARATFAQTDEFLIATATDDFTIYRKTGSGTIKVADIYYGETLNPVVASDANGTGNVTIEYKRKDAGDETYTETEPTLAGEYTARATFAQTDEFLIATATDDFEIFRIEGEGTVTASDIHYGETISPVVTSTTNGTDNVTYEYKVKGAADTTYTQTAPTKVGTYTVRATFAQTDIYNAVTATGDFEILRNEGTGTVTVETVYYGGTISPVVTSTTNGTDNVTYEYKVKGAADTTYTQTAPTKVGAYTVRATFAQTDIYNEVTATCDFEISYLEAPEAPYSISGKQGADGYYTSDVIITPAEGYLIAETLDGNYREELTVGESEDKFNIYLKKIATGEKTAAIQVTVIRIDMDSPTILNAGSGEKIYGEQVEVIIKDDNLARVLVNGEAVEFENHMAILQLSSNLGEETYEIICIDAAGNTSKTTIVVAADWMKERTIPTGSMVRLSTEYSYHLGGGTWQVEGDGTSYAGDSIFYVSSDGEYTFTKID